MDNRRIRMIIEYDGGSYHGFQRQANASTIQEELEKAILRLTGEMVTVLGAGRTDAGVHALGQVVAFDTSSSIPAERWKVALNTYLPLDIRVVSAGRAEAGFHPQFQALRKTYMYKIFRSDCGCAFHRNHALCLSIPLAVSEMQRASAYFTGFHDFRSFCAAGSRVRSFEREVYHCALRDEWPWLIMEIEANGFLYNMVRIIMGTLLQVGQEKIPADQIPLIIAARDRALAGATASPQGLYMVKVEY